MIIFLSIFTILILALLIGNLKYSQNFEKGIQKLFSSSKNISRKKFSYDQLEGLPPPAQRYFKNVLKEGQPYINSVRLKHNGLFKTHQNKSWSTIEGEQYFTAGTPGFIWKGKIGILSACDMYLNNKGRLVISLLNTINIVDGQGENFNQGELLRWLGESVWFPTNILPSEKLKWIPIDNTSAKLIFNHDKLSLFYIVKFNKNNEIIQLETERYYNDTNLKPWVGNFENYKEINGVKVPTIIKATWKLEEGDHTYVNFHLKEIEYDKPEKY